MHKLVGKKPQALPAAAARFNLSLLFLLALLGSIGLAAAQAQADYTSFCRAILAKREIVLSGGIVIDSFDSDNPSLSTNGRYAAAKHSDSGDIASTSDSVKTISGSGNAKVYGHVATGTNGTVVNGGNASFGSLAWVNGGNRGVQPGWYTNNVADVIPDTQLPALNFVTMPKSRGTIGGVTYQYVLRTGNYRGPSGFALQSSQKMAITGNVVLYLPDGLRLSGSAQIYITPGSKLTIYLGGNGAIGGKGVVNGTGFATNCAYIGLPTCLSIEQNGSSDFVGTIYAPTADVKLTGGGTTTTHFVGAVVVRSVTMSGRAEFHYDQSLCGPRNRAPIANNDSFSTPEGMVLAVGTPGILANDTDPETNSLSAVLATGTTHGALTISSNGSFNYAPVANYSGPDSFTYRATDGKATSGVATVTITVVPKPIVIVEPPIDQTNCLGENVTFSITASGTALRYQWLFGKKILAGETNSTLTLRTVGLTNAGIYCVVVNGAAGGPITNCATLTVRQNVIVTTPPANQTVCENTTAQFTVAATGTDLSYQWYFGATLLNSQTANTLVLNNVSMSAAGIYTVVVSGACGAPVTNRATLTVNGNVSITTPPASQRSVVGGSATFSVVASGTGLSYQWFFNGTRVGTNNTLVLSNLATNQAGTYCVIVSGACGRPVTNCTTLEFDNRAPVANNDAYTVTAGMTLNISGPGVLANDTDPDGDTVTAVVPGNPMHGTLTLNANGAFTYLPNTNYSGSDSFTYRAHDGKATSAVATVTITVVPVPIVIVSPPTSRTNCPGETATFNVTTTGTAVTYQWVFGTNILAAQTNSTLVLNSVTAVNAGTYCVVVNGAAGGPITRCATLVVNENVIVSTPPASQTVCENETTIFRVTATGTALTYQWYYGANATTLLNGQTSDRLVLTNVTTSSAGRYTVVIRGVCGSSITNSATLIVNQKITIVTPPLNQTSVVGSNVTFGIVATGTGLTYQWLFNGSIMGTNSSLTLTSITTNRAGTYCVIVRGTCGSPTTNCVILTIQNRPPVANDDNYVIAEDSLLTIGALGVLTNDSDPDGDSLRAILETGPKRGTLSLNADGSFVYRPNTNFNGTDTFTYRANDTKLGSAPATVTITVTPVNDLPVPGVEGDSYTALEDRNLTVGGPGVLANDTDVDKDVLRAVLLSGPAHGALTLNADGSFTYRPDADYFGDDTFRYAANDGISNSLPAVVSIIVTPVNDAPSFTKGADQRVNPNVPLQRISNWARNISPGPANELYQSVSFVVVNDNYTLFSVPPSIAPDGTLTYTPSPTRSGVANVSVVLRDDGGSANGGQDTSAEATFRIVVNTPPTVSLLSPTNGSVYLAPATLTVIANALDMDGTVTNVQFLADGAVIGNVSSTPFYLCWSNVAVGSYALRAIATDDGGLTATSSVVNVSVISNAVAAVGPIVLNRQNGLFEQFVTVSNSTPELWPNGVRLWVYNLDSTNKLWNPTGTNNGAFYLEKLGSVPSGGTMVFLIQYYIPNLRSFPNPTLVAVPLPYTRSVEYPRITRVVMDGGKNNLHFSTQSGRFYFVQCSEDLVNWTTVPNPMQGTGEVIVCPQSRDLAKRFYRVMMVP